MGVSFISVPLKETSLLSTHYWLYVPTAFLKKSIWAAWSEKTIASRAPAGILSATSHSGWKRPLRKSVPRAVPGVAAGLTFLIRALRRALRHPQRRPTLTAWNAVTSSKRSPRAGRSHPACRAAIPAVPRQSSGAWGPLYRGRPLQCLMRSLPREATATSLLSHRGEY